MNFTLPFGNITKGELVTELAKNDLGKLAKATVSCVHFPLRETFGKQCGVCPACLFRRQAMLIAGIDDAADAYRFDLFTGCRELKEATARHLRFLKAYLMQVRELQDVRPGKPLPDRVLQHLVGTNIIKQSDATSPSIELLSRYRDQWMQVVREAESNGYSWTKMIGPSGPSKEGVSHASA